MFGEVGGALRPVAGDVGFEYRPSVGQMTYRPTVEDGGVYRVVVRASDIVGNAAEQAWTFAVDTREEDVANPTIVILSPAPGSVVDDTTLDALAFSVSDATGIASVYLFVNDPRRERPLSLGQLVDEGIAAFDGATGAVRVFARRLFAPAGRVRGGVFVLDPLELNALERDLTAGAGDADLRSAWDYGDAADGEAGLQNSLARSPGLLGAGTHTIGVQATDISGNVAFAEWSFDVRLDAPAAPVFDETRIVTSASPIHVTGHVPGGAGVSVGLQVDDQLVTIVQAGADGSFAFAALPLPHGESRLTAFAQNVAGNVGELSEPLFVVVDAEAPGISLGDIPAATGTDTVTVAGRVTGGVSSGAVRVWVEVNGVATSLTAAGGDFSFAVPLTADETDIVVRAVDDAGNTTETPAAVVRRDTAMPTTAPTELRALPHPKGGLSLTWTADAAASAYRVFRSLGPLPGIVQDDPLAAGVRAAGRVDTDAEPGVTYYYGVASESAAGVFDPSRVTRAAAVTLVDGRGAVIVLADGTRLGVPPGALGDSPLSRAVIALEQPTNLPRLERAVVGSARGVTALDAGGAPFVRFSEDARLSIPVGAGVPLTTGSPGAYLLDGVRWTETASTRNRASRTVTTTLRGPGVTQLAAAGVDFRAADLDGNGVVDIADLVNIGQSFGSMNATGSAADLNGDGVVDIVDLVSVATMFGERLAPAAPARRQVVSAAGESAVRVTWDARHRSDGTVTYDARVASIRPIAGFTVAVRADASGEVAYGDLLGSSAFRVAPAAMVTRDVAVTRLVAVALGLPRASRDGIIARVRTHDGAPRPRIVDADFRDERGKPLAYAIEGEAAVVATLRNYPNPFNPETWIPFDAPGQTRLAVMIYDARGRAIRRIDLGSRERGRYTERGAAAHWDGRNDAGESVASGVYYYVVKGSEDASPKRMTLAK